MGTPISSSFCATSTSIQSARKWSATRLNGPGRAIAATSARRRYLDFLQAVGDAGKAATETPAAAKLAEKRDSANLIDRDRIEEALLRFAQDICAEHHVPIEDLRGATRRRDASRARRALIRRCQERGLRPGSIAAFLRRSPAAISKVINLRP